MSNMVGSKMKHGEDHTPGADQPRKDSPEAKSRGHGKADEKVLTSSPSDMKKKIPFGFPRKSRDYLNADKKRQEELLFDSDTGRIESTDDDVNEGSTLVTPPVENTLATPRPPIDDRAPGAYRVSGIDGPGEDANNASFSFGNSHPFTNVPTSETPSLDHPVTAELVNTEEEELRIRELEEQNRKLREREQTATYATVLGKSEILKSFFNLRDPEFRRQRIFGLGIIVLAVAGIVLGIVFTRDNSPSEPSTPSPTPAPTLAPTSALHGSLSDFLSSVSFDGGAALSDQTTPQYQAVKWLTNNTNIENYADKQIIQRYSLATFYFSTEGENWGTSDLWLENSPECKWTNVACTSQDEVSRLLFQSNRLNGTIPPEIALLSNSLGIIEFQENELIGTIPTEFQFLSVLTTLDLNENSLSGKIMSGFGVLSNLSFLGMGDNRLSGTIPTELFKLTNLLTLRMGNELSGTIPSLLGRLTGLVQLSMPENPRLTGIIPSSIGMLTRLTRLSLYLNGLSGSIPSNIALLTSLERLYLEEMENLNGTIPSEATQLTNLIVFNLFGNSLSGPIPLELGVMTSLEEINLYNNKLTGNIPETISSLTDLEELIISRNSLNGTIPLSIGRMTNLAILFLNQNRLSGPIPNEIGDMKSLVRISLRDNELTGTIPPVIHNLTHLESLALYNNNLTGPFTCSPNVPKCQVSCDGDDDICRVL